MTRRIQRKRTRGWRMPEDAVYVGRPTRYGNPYRGTREEAVAKYEVWLRGRLSEDPHFLDPLRGKNLACWCPLSKACHVDVILKLLEESTH